MANVNALIKDAFAGELKHLLAPVHEAVATIDRIPPTNVLQPAPRGSLLFGEIAEHIISLRREIDDLKRKHTDPSSDSHLAKRRKLASDVDPQQNGSVSKGVVVSPTATASLSAKDISFSIPQRKKFTLEFIPSDAGGGAGGIRAVNPATGDVEFGLAWTDIDQIICVPVPEKAQPQYNFIVAPYQTATASHESIIWTVPATSVKSLTHDTTRYQVSSTATSTYEVLLLDILNHELRAHSKHVIEPTAGEFASALIQPHLKHDKAYHVKAHRGSKDGFLYFLGPGILWGFKKPIGWFPFAVIRSISYTSVLQRTFNLNVAVSSLDSGREAAGEEDNEVNGEEIEFSMIDQADFAGIDKYVKQHGLNDASLAAGRKAKRFNVNPVKMESNGEANAQPAAVGDEEMEEPEGELEKAEREIQDAEDEEEEDYDPGSEGESEGSGTSDEEDDKEGYVGDDEVVAENIDEHEEEDDEDDDDDDDVETHGPGDGCAGHGEDRTQGRDGTMFGYKLDRM